MCQPQKIQALTDFLIQPENKNPVNWEDLACSKTSPGKGYGQYLGSMPADLQTDFLNEEDQTE